jgi:hypothetical protein
MQSRTASLGVAFLATAAISLGAANAQDVNAAPNPYRALDTWAQLPEGRVFAPASW